MAKQSVDFNGNACRLCVILAACWLDTFQFGVHAVAVRNEGAISILIIIVNGIRHRERFEAVNERLHDHRDEQTIGANGDIVVKYAINDACGDYLIAIDPVDLIIERALRDRGVWTGEQTSLKLRPRHLDSDTSFDAWGRGRCIACEVGPEMDRTQGL